MVSVTQRIKQVKQPRGGYIQPSCLQKHEIDDNRTLHSDENIHASVMGMVVDYMTRFLAGAEKKEAFSISLRGAEVAENYFQQDGSIDNVTELLKSIQGLDDASLIAASELVRYDVWYRNPLYVVENSGSPVVPDNKTLENMRIMIERGLAFFEAYGPITANGFNFEGGYSEVVNTGDGDFLTADTLWDFKVSKAKPTSKHTLQLLMYWIMGEHSQQDIFTGINRIGIFNPRLNTVYLLDIASVSADVITTVEKDVICY